MNKKQIAIKKLKGIKRFNLSWVDEVEKSINIEAKDKDEAEKLFHNGEIDFDKAEFGIENLVEGSLMVEEIEYD